MKKSKIIATAVLAASMASFGVIAEEKKQAGSGPNPYVDCGIGAALFPDTHWAAITSNATWDLGTTAVISATASPETCNGKKAQAAAFILDTYDNLVEETAKGDGEHFAALMNILESEAEQHSAILQQVRAGMATHIASSEYDRLNPVEKATIYYNLIDKAVSNG